MKIDWRPSPHFSSRQGYEVAGVVLHYTAAGKASGSIRWFEMKESKVSAHYVIDRSGQVTQMVQLRYAAWHAGASQMDYKGELTSNANRFTIGIELANRGKLIELNGSPHYPSGRGLEYFKGPCEYAELEFDNGHYVQGWWESYPDDQIAGLLGLLSHLEAEGYEEAVRNIVGHEEIAVPFSQRKIDPGPLFPWHFIPRKEEERRTKAIIYPSLTVE